MRGIMITKTQRNLLADADSEIQKAAFNLFKTSIYLEQVDAIALNGTILEIKKTIKDLKNSSGEIIDFMNSHDFPRD